MEENKIYSTELADLILENFKLAQIKRFVYLDRMPAFIFRLEKDENEIKDYERLSRLIRGFKGNLEWGVFKCPGSKINYMITPLEWNEIEKSPNYNGEEFICNSEKYLELLDFAKKDYKMLVEYLKINI